MESQFTQLENFHMGLTDLIITIEAICFFILFSLVKGDVALSRLVKISIVLIFIASMSGFIFHIFFPEFQSGTLGHIFWTLVLLTLGSISSVMWGIISVLIENKVAKKLFLITAILSELLVFLSVFFITQNFRHIIIFNIPPLFTLSILSLCYYLKSRQNKWLGLFSGCLFFILSPVAVFIPLSIQKMTFGYSSYFHIFQAFSFFLICYSLMKIITTQKSFK